MEKSMKDFYFEELIKKCIDDLKRLKEVPPVVVFVPRKRDESEPEFPITLKTAPKDISEIVRCKDCKYLNGKAPWGDSFRCDHPNQCYDTECDDQWLCVELDDFCSYGVRKEDK